MSESGDPELEELHVFYHGDLSFVERVARVYVRRPRVMYAAVWTGILLISVIVASAGWFNIQDTTSYDWTVADSQESKNDDALLDARDQVDAVIGSASIAIRSEKADFTDVAFIYEWADDNRGDEILIPENLQRMCQFQRTLTSDPDFRKFCLPSGAAAGLATSCASQDLDIVGKVYITDAEKDACALRSAGDVQTLLAAVPPLLFDFFLERTVELPSDVRTKTRSQVSLYGPLGADSTPDGASYTAALDDDTGPQADIYQEFLLRVEENIFKEQGLEVSTPFSSGYLVGAFDLGGGLQVRFETFFWRRAEFNRVVAWDQLLAAGSVLFVGVAMVLHLRSLWLTLNGLFSIIFQFPVALFLYAGIGGIDYLNTVHIVSIFVILGIGANAIYVYMDAFLQSKRYWYGVRGMRSTDEAAKRNIYGTGNVEQEVLIARVAYTYLRAAGTILNTSATTAAAFFATGVSPVAPVAAFGLFAGLLVLVGFVFSLILYPAIAVLFEKYFTARPLCCACVRERQDPVHDEVAVVPAGKDGAETVSSTTDSADDAEKDMATREVIYIVRPPHKESWEERTFSRGYVPLMQRSVRVEARGRTFKFRPVAWTCSAALLVLFIVMATLAVQLDTPTELAQNFRSSHMSSGFQTDYGLVFKGGSDFMKVTVVFGIAGVARGDFSRFDPNGFRGSAVFDEDFDLAPSANQQFVLDMCAALPAVSCVVDGKQFPGCISDTGLAVLSVDCTLQTFYKWHNDTYFPEGPIQFIGDSNATLFYERLQEYVEARGRDQDIGFVDGRLRFFTLEYEAALKILQPVNVKEPLLDVLTEFLEAQRAVAPAGMRSVFQTSFDYTWIKTELGIVSGMFQGLAISLPIAYAVLLIATSNVLLSTIAIFAIVGIVASVLGTAYMLGWSLGVAEAIAAVMVVGLSVDFSTIHGTAYTHAGREGVQSRVGRFRYSATMVGPTVIAGALTTAGSASVMFGCVLQFFPQMATLLTTTMLFSLVFTEGFFMPLALVIGPEKDRSDWVLWIKARRAEWRK